MIENAVRGASLPRESSSSVCTYDSSYQQRPLGKQPDCAEVSHWQSPLPHLPLHAKVVVVELQCPACFRIWRSAATCVLLYTDGTFRYDPQEGQSFHDEVKERERRLALFPALQPYFVGHQGPPASAQFHLAYYFSEEPQYHDSPTLCYSIQYPGNLGRSRWLSKQYSFHLTYTSHIGPTLHVDQMPHSSNDILAAQASCPTDLSLDEFIACGHLRSSGSLQWLNILQGLRNRSLNLRRHQVHFLLAHTAFQVGPLDLNTGTWIWHQELQESSFCNALLGELENLFLDVGAASIDGVLMSTISLLLTRILASNPSEDVSERAIALLRRVRRKTFSWIQDLSYDLAKAPTNEERRNVLLDMASTCRSTFDVDPATLHKLFDSAEDVDALLSCAFFLNALRYICELCLIAKC